MPDSKADLARRSNEEIVNYHEHGDARGPHWLETHPSDAQAAEERMHSLPEGAQDRSSSPGPD